MADTDGSPKVEREQPWLIRTYSGHSSASASNALYRTNLAKGQTGLSVAFDLPTQTGYDADHVLARGEVGKVGVPIGHLGDMRTPQRSRAPRAPTSPARRRTTSSRSTCRAGPTSSRPGPRCG
jgi:hypothetical protein